MRNAKGKKITSPGKEAPKIFLSPRICVGSRMRKTKIFTSPRNDENFLSPGIRVECGIRNSENFTSPRNDENFSKSQKCVGSRMQNYEIYYKS